VATAELQSALAQFVTFARSLKGDEKSEAQSFLDHFFRALGHAGVIEAGATFEFRVAKKPGSPQLELIKGNGAGMRAKGGKKFADLLWPDRVLIEMKSRGEKLEKHYDQTFEYWTHIVPHRPPFVILCNFDEFWIYDFNTQLFDPVDRIPLSDLPENIASFNFLLPVWKKPIFGNNRVEVTRKAADQMATVFREIVERGEDRQRAQRFILQLLVSMVAEDIGLLPREIVTELLYECAEKDASSYDLIGSLFRQMATAEKARGGRFEKVDYFNGGLFEVVDPIELKRPESYRLHEAARYNDWSKVRPEIFGTLFQDSMDKKERHAYGGHFTSEFDIRKVVGPTIVRPWRERIDIAGKNVGELRKALADLRKFRVLDPACGSGNFLFIAYREMKRLERDILLRLREVSKREALESAISLNQFFGIDIIPFAVELAKVTLMLAKELELIEAQKLAETDQLLIEEKPLPLDNLDKNIICADALFTDWPKADAIIGNPPFLGASRIRPEHGDEYVNTLRARYPKVRGMSDFCVYWFRRAHDQLQSPTIDNPTTGRAGLVGTQNIRSGDSRTVSLDYMTQSGTIVDAVANQPWSGEANVNVSIVNWVKSQDGKVVPGERFLWLTDRPSRPDKKIRKEKTFQLRALSCAVINSSLSCAVDVAGAQTLNANSEPQCIFRGFEPGNMHFLLKPDDAWRLAAGHECPDVVRPYLTGKELVTGDGTPQRWIIDFGKRTLFDAESACPGAFEQVKSFVLPQMEQIARKEDGTQAADSKEFSDRIRKRNLRARLDRWWQLRRSPQDTRDAIRKLRRYIVCPRVTKRATFEFVGSAITPGDKLVIFGFEDDYSFGVLQSRIHWEWFTTKCSKQLERFIYNPTVVFDTFPWPQEPTRAQIKAVAEAAVALRALRRETMRKLNYSLRQLYRTLDQSGANPLREAHARLDDAVRAAYGMAEHADPLAFLLELNLACAAKEKAGQKITSPGLPLPERERNAFTTEDCIHL
jgi:SAM-dependent methyltransferase